MVVDVETSGLNALEDSLIAIGALAVGDGQIELAVSPYDDSWRCTAPVTDSCAPTTPLGICQKRPPLKWRCAFSTDVYSRR